MSEHQPLLCRLAFIDWVVFPWAGVRIFDELTLVGVGVLNTGGALILDAGLIGAQIVSFTEWILGRQRFLLFVLKQRLAESLFSLGLLG